MPVDYVPYFPKTIEGQAVLDNVVRTRRLLSYRDNDKDCTAAEGPWRGDAEIKIDKRGFVIRDGARTRDLWDATLPCPRKPKRIKVRSIAGDETLIVCK